MDRTKVSRHLTSNSPEVEAYVRRVKECLEKVKLRGFQFPLEVNSLFLPAHQLEMSKNEIRSRYYHARRSANPSSGGKVDRARLALAERDFEREMAELQVKIDEINAQRAQKVVDQELNIKEYGPLARLYEYVLTARNSREGLAIWDEEILTDEQKQCDGKRLLSAKEVIAMFEEKLGVGRTIFYKRYRPLLRTHALKLGAAEPRPGSFKRTRSRKGVKGQWYRRTEVEALIEHLTTAVL